MRAGVHDADDEIQVETPGLTLRSFPGERATLRGRLWIKRSANGTSVRGIDLDGRNVEDLPSPTVNADRVVLRGNDITNFNTAICISLGNLETYGRARETLIVKNEIHDCGTLPATNLEHGIYVNAARDAVIRENWIHDNADRGIQLYPDAQGTLITGNLIENNGQGIIFGGSNRYASSDNVVERNVIVNSQIRSNIESSWAGPVGSGNVARENCVGGGANAAEGGIERPAVGFEADRDSVAPSLAAVCVLAIAIKGAGRLSSFP